MDTQKRSDWTEFIPFVAWPLVKLFGPGILRTGPVLVITAVMLVGGLALAWRFWGSEVTQQSQFQLRAENIVLPAQPEWIITDVCAEVLDDSLRRATLLDTDLTVRLARAFSAHPWVSKVRHVSKTPPATIEVDLEYRTPVAMVEMTGDVYAIDATGTLLPSDYFLANPDQVRRYPRVLVDRANLSVPVGATWGDHRIVAASQIAAILVSQWDKFGLYRIGLLSPVSPHETTPPTFVLSNKRGARIIWGHAPKKESSGESSAQEKLRRLESFVERRGSLAELSESTVIDLNDTTSLRLQPQVSPARQTR